MNKQIGSKFQALRMRQGLTQAEVAKDMKWSTVQFVSNIERGLAMPPKGKIKRFAKLYKVKPEEIGQLFVDLYRSKLDKYI